MEANSSYTLTLSGLSIRDLNGHALDQNPTTLIPDSFTLNFRTPPVLWAALTQVTSGRGSVISGSHLYVLDQGKYNYLDTYDISVPSKPVLQSQVQLLGAPRDLTVVPHFRYVRNVHAPVETNDLVAVVGGDLDATLLDTQSPNLRTRGQYLWVLNMGNPASPEILASPIVTLRVGSAVTKVRWAPPYLVYEEFGADIQQLSLVNLQEMLIGFDSSPVQQTGFPPLGQPGVDTNYDGDYVDPGERPPLPPSHPPQFYGWVNSYVLQHTTQKLLDFSVTYGAGAVGITTRDGLQLDNNGNPTGVTLAPCYRTLVFNGTALDIKTPTNAAVFFDSTAYPRWVSIFDSLEVVSNGIPLTPVLALVSLQPDSDGIQKLAVIDISLPESPKLVNKITIPVTLLGTAIQSVTLRSDGKLEVAGSQNVVLLDPAHLEDPDPPAGELHSSIVGLIPAAGAGTHSLGSTDFGVYGVADSGRALVIQTAPSLSFVSFPLSINVLDPSITLPSDDQTLTALMRNMLPALGLRPARVHNAPTLNLTSDLDPPQPAAHYYVLVQAPGTSGPTIELGLESLNFVGRPLPNPGNGFAPVRAVSDYTQQQIGQPPRPDCGAPIRSLTAYRMSANPQSTFYNRYLSRPLAMVYEKVSLDELAGFKSKLDREILWGGSRLRAFIDPGEATNDVIGAFAGQIDQGLKLLHPIASTTVYTYSQSYIPGDNPPPIGGAMPMPASYGMIMGHSGEIRTAAADMVLPSPRMPITIQRAIGNQDTYDGPFGVGWDFNYNQRLTILDPLTFPAGLQLPLIIRDTQGDSEIASSQDVLFHTGQGRIIHFRWVANTMPSVYAQDPLATDNDHDYQDLASDFYLPEPGVFDLLVKFKDRRFERLTPDGTRYDYTPDGRLESIRDRYPANQHYLTYDKNDWLIEIDDYSVSPMRWLRLGHYRRITDPSFQSDVDQITDNGFTDGKICCLTNYAGQDVQFFYNNATLIRREGILVDGENGGYAGRNHTYYTYNGCQLVGIGVGSDGAPLLSVVNDISSDGKPVAKSGTGIGGNLQLNIPTENTAANLTTLNNAATLADSSSTQLQFDNLGYPTSVSVSDGTSPTAKIKSKYTGGLLTFTAYPEGNTKTIGYDTQNPAFRSRGNLKSVTVDPGPRGGQAYTQTFSYEPKYNLKFGDQKNADGFIWTYELTPDGRDVGAIHYGTAGSETFAYNASGQLISHVDIRGVQATVVYRAADGFIDTRSMGNNVSTYHYGNDLASQCGRPMSITLPEGAPIEMKYNRNLQPIEIKRGALVEEFAYDEQGRTIYRQQQLGDGKSLTTHSIFDEKSFLRTNITDGVEVGGQGTSLEYDFTPDALSRIQSIRRPGGTLQSFNYDSRGNVTTMTMGDYVENYTFDLNNNRTSTKQGGDLVKVISYDGFDRPLTVTLKTGIQDDTEAFTYYPRGEVNSRTITDGQFGVISQESNDQIDEVGRSVHRTISGTTISPTYQYVYAPGSRIVTGPRKATENTWDTAGYDTGVIDPMVNPILKLALHPNGNGHVTESDRAEDGATYTDTFTFDPQDNRTSASDDLGIRFAYSARAEGSLLTTTDALGNTTTFDHSALNELLKARRQDGMEIQLQHDPERHVSYTGDPTAGFHFGYDPDLRLSSSTLRSGAATTYAGFDHRNLPQSATIPGGTVTMTYDFQRRLTSRTANYQSTVYEFHRTYDALDRLRMVTYKQDAGPLNTAKYSYDEAGPLLSAEYQEDGADFTVKYGYYNDSARQSVTYPSGVTVAENRDTSGRLTALSDANGNIIQVLSWQGNKQPRIVRLGATMEVVNSYDARGRITGSRTTRLSDGAVLTHLRYQYDAADNQQIRQFLHRNGKADNFFYDSGERLSEARIGTLPISPGFTPPLYDRGYNYHLGGLDYLTSTATTNLTANIPAFATNWSSHDDFLLPTVVDGFNRGQAEPLGNVALALLQTRPPGASGTVPISATLNHNGNGSLIRITRADGVLVENFFQPNGLRYERRVSQGGQVADFRHFVYDEDGRLLEEYEQTNGTPSLIARYYYATADSPEAADLQDPLTGTLRRYYFLKDNTQSVIAVADVNGVVVERAWYDPFGQPALQTRDTTPPVIAKVIGGDAGSLMLIFSEPVWSTTPDPGPGGGIIRLSDQLTNLLTVTLTPTNGPSQVVQGTYQWLPSLPGFTPYSVVGFSPTQALSGPLSIVLNGGAIEDEWGNTNLMDNLTLEITGTVATVYYSAQPDPQTGALPVARSSVGSPFLFHGQYFDYDCGLIDLRSRFYDPFSGMFIEPDPLGYESSANPYAAFANSPLSFRDPTGLLPEGLLSGAGNFFRRLFGGARSVETVTEDGRELESAAEAARAADNAQAEARAAANPALVRNGDVAAEQVANRAVAHQVEQEALAARQISEATLTEAMARARADGAVLEGTASSRLYLEISGKEAQDAADFYDLTHAGLEEDPVLKRGGELYLEEQKRRTADNAYWAVKTPPEEGFFDVFIHGDPGKVFYGSRELDAKHLADWIYLHPEWGGKNIRLFSCETGLLDNGFAQQLSRELGVTVRAPTALATSPGNLRPDLFERVGDKLGAIRDFFPTGAPRTLDWESWGRDERF